MIGLNINTNDSFDYTKSIASARKQFPKTTGKTRKRENIDTSNGK